ncbi:hypothetical protein [Coleofasciculus sp. G1-WW12-02]|uniref:hypothetical protein n=1 Tax=Coleofasciculus sp. G1-WW12-02 TaxID=3068483 RepID=UPI0040631A62
MFALTPLTAGDSPKLHSHPESPSYMSQGSVNARSCHSNTYWTDDTSKVEKATEDYQNASLSYAYLVNKGDELNLTPSQLNASITMARARKEEAELAFIRSIDSAIATLNQFPADCYPHVTVTMTVFANGFDDSDGLVAGEILISIPDSIEMLEQHRRMILNP